MLAALVAGFAMWALLPRDLGTVTVEGVHLLPAGASDDDTNVATPVRIAVTFTVPEDIAAVRERLGLGYVAARLAGCDDDAAAVQEVIDQRADHLGDRGRVARLGTTPAGRVRYRVVFDDAPSATIDHVARRTPARAAPGGLCLSLYGASMWFGHATSDAVPIGSVPR